MIWINYFRHGDRALKELRENAWSWEKDRDEGHSLALNKMHLGALAAKKVLFIRQTKSSRTFQIGEEN